MPSYNNDLFNIEPYFDDFSEDKNYHKILFKPGFSVQARELSQVQTILQNQIERFGNHIFKDGSKVYGADSAFQTVDFIRVTSTSPITSFSGFEVSSEDNINVAKVIHVEDATTDDNFYILFVQVVKGTLANLVASTTLTSSIDTEVATATVGGTTQSGKAKLFSVSEGIFFIDGYFVRTEEQHAPAFATSTAGVRQYGDRTGVFGFDIQKNYIGSNEDETLRDPARGFYNFNAPGSDRYQIVLDLSFFTSAERDNFVPLATLSGGIITNQVVYSDYSELEKTLARRTFDESGSYITDPFELEVQAHSTDTSKLTLNIGSGKAYIFGHEFENQTIEFKDLDKARSTATRESTEVKPFQLGNYIDQLEVLPDGPAALGDAFFDGGLVEGGINLDIYKDGTLSATATVISVQTDVTGENLRHRFYLKDILVSPNQNLIGDNSEFQLRAGGDIVVARKTGVIGPLVTEGENQSLVFPVDKGTTVKDITDLKVRIRKAFTGLASNGESIVISLPALIQGNYSFVGSLTETLDNNFVDTYYQLFQREPENGNISIVPAGSYSMDNEGSQLTISGLDAGVSYMLLATLELDTNPSQAGDNGIRRKIQRTDVLTVTSADIEEGRNYIELNRADVLKINSVVDNNNVSVINDFLFDNGQRDYSYEYGRLYFTQSSETKYKNEDQEFSFSLTVNYDYFEHDGFGPLTVDSYPLDAINYEDIPLFTSPISGRTVSLASCVDFRFTRDGPRRANPTDPNIGTEDPPAITPLSSSSAPVFQTDQTRENDVLKVKHNYYLPRIDKLVLNRDLNNETTIFSVVKGFPSLSPLPPEDIENSLTLYKMIIPAYTHNPEDVILERTPHKRYTMSEIGEVDKRLEQVELLSSLTNIEAKVDAISFIDRFDPTKEADKKAILVDDFGGHGIGDVSKEDYKCSIDIQNKELRPSFKSHVYDLTAQSVDAGLTVDSNGIVMVNYDANGVTLAAQTKASETLSLNPYQVTNWVGTIHLDDPIDVWFDETKRPRVKTNTRGENDAWVATSYDDTRVGFGSQWNDWEAIWSGIASDKKPDTTKVKNLLSVPRVNESLNTMRERFEKDLILQRRTKSVEQRSNEIISSISSFPDHIIKTLKGKIVDLSVVPYMRAKLLTVTVEGLKPNTTVDIFLDNRLANSYVTTPGFSNVTDDTGRLQTFAMVIPTSTFLSGKRILKIIDSDNTTVAETTLFSQGVYETRSQGISSVRPIIRRRQTVDSSAVPTDVNTRKSELRTSKKYQWVDPFAQTFFVDESENPQGIFLQTVEVFFAKKDSTLPVTFQIRPTKNGYPHPSAIIPFSEVVVYPSSINVNESTPGLGTKVTFKTPVYLEPGEYALCMVSNSKDYEVYTATTGATELVSVGTPNRIQKQVYSGKLFRPQNTNIAEPDYTRDLMFNINRCEFVTSGNKSITLAATNTESSHKAHLSRLISYIQKPVTTETQITYSLLDNAAINENSNIPLNDEKTVDTDAGTFTVTFLNGNSDVSPVMDSRSTALLHIENEVNNNIGTQDDEEPAGSSVGSAVRYISKRVELLDNNLANDFHVFIDAIKPENTQYEIYVKAREAGDSTDFDLLSYRRLQRISTEKFSEDGSTIVTEEFRLSDTNKKYTSFAIKVCLYSGKNNNEGSSVVDPDGTVVPIIKSIRAVALEHGA